MGYGYSLTFSWGRRFAGSDLAGKPVQEFPKNRLCRRPIFGYNYILPHAIASLFVLPRIEP